MDKNVRILTFLEIVWLDAESPVYLNRQSDMCGFELLSTFLKY